MILTAYLLAAAVVASLIVAFVCVRWAVGRSLRKIVTTWAVGLACGALLSQWPVATDSFFRINGVLVDFTLDFTAREALAFIGFSSGCVGGVLFHAWGWASTIRSNAVGLPHRDSSSIHDPVLGQLTRERHGWTGTIPSPTGKGFVHLRIAECAQQDTVEIDSSSLMKFLDNYAEMTDSLRLALFELFKPYLPDPLWKDNWPTSAEALWDILQLEEIELKPTGELGLSYAFIGDIWPDAMFSLLVDGAPVNPMALDD